MDLFNKLQCKIKGHTNKCVAFDPEGLSYITECQRCGYEKRIKIKNKSHYPTEDEIAEWAGDSEPFLQNHKGHIYTKPLEEHI